MTTPSATSHNDLEPTIFQETLGINNYYFGSKDFGYPMGPFQFVGKLDVGDMEKAYALLWRNQVNLAPSGVVANQIGQLGLSKAFVVRDLDGQAVEIEEKLGGDVSAGIAQPVVITADWLLDLRHDELSSLAMAGSGIDDPVNDTGLGPERGDLQLANEFVCLIKVM